MMAKSGSRGPKWKSEITLGEDSQRTVFKEI